MVLAMLHATQMYPCLGNGSCLLVFVGTPPLMTGLETQNLLTGVEAHPLMTGVEAHPLMAGHDHDQDLHHQRSCHHKDQLSWHW